MHFQGLGSQKHSFLNLTFWSLLQLETGTTPCKVYVHISWTLYNMYTCKLSSWILAIKNGSPFHLNILLFSISSECTENFILCYFVHFLRIFFAVWIFRKIYASRILFSNFLKIKKWVFKIISLLDYVYKDHNLM